MSMPPDYSSPKNFTYLAGMTIAYKVWRKDSELTESEKQGIILQITHKDRIAGRIINNRILIKNVFRDNVTVGWWIKALQQ